MEKKRVQRLERVWMKPDERLLRRAKSAAALQGLPLADVIHQALSDYVNSFFAQNGNGGKQ